MTPGDVSMMLTETNGLRVQVTSPSLGAANVRVQGLRGRYTQILSDGLPLYGQAGSIGILQIPPMDLAQVEVIKGVASTEVARRLSERGLFASHGDFYAQTVVDRLDLQPEGLVRVGCACYTSDDEIERLIDDCGLLD